MKVKTSVTLSPELLQAIDQRCGMRARSEFIERASWQVIRAAERAERDRREIAIINANADRLNAEALEVLEMQADPWDRHEPR